MALARKCDICGKLYEPYNEKKNSENPNGFMLLSNDTTNQYFSYGKIDCCPDCMESILQRIDQQLRKEQRRSSYVDS